MEMESERWRVMVAAWDADDAATPLALQSVNDSFTKDVHGGRGP